MTHTDGRRVVTNLALSLEASSAAARACSTTVCRRAAGRWPATPPASTACSRSSTTGSAEQRTASGQPTVRLMLLTRRPPSYHVTVSTWVPVAIGAASANR